MLEKKIENRQEYKREFFDTKAAEIKEDIASIEVDKVKCKARNRNLLENIQKALNQGQQNTNKLGLMRQNLEEQKR